MAVKILNGIDVDGSMNIVASDVPNLDASKITSGTFSADRIPNLSGVYQPAGEYLTLETAETTFQPLGNYLTTASALDANRISSGTLDGARMPWNSNDEFTGTYSIVWRATNDLYTSSWLQVRGTDDALLTRKIVAGDNPIVARSIGFADAGLLFQDNDAYKCIHPTTMDGTAHGDSISLGWSNNKWKDGYFAGILYANGGNSNEWNAAYDWGNHASVGYLTSLPSHNHDTLYDALGSADAVNVRIDEEVFPALNDLGNAIPTNNNQLTNGAGYITSADGGNAATLEGRKADDFLKANDTPLSNTDLDTLYDDDSTLYYSNSEYNTNTNIPFNNYFTLLNIRNPYGDNTGDAASSLDRGNQLWFGDTPNKFYVRYFQGTSTGWHPWERVWTDHSFSDTNVSNWNTAYGWGNHASAGYLKSIPASYATDAEVSSAVGAIETSINERIDTEVIPSIPTNNNQLTNGAGYITGYTETDTLNSVVSRNGSTGNQVNLSSSSNRFNGHHYFDQYDSSGNHYPHYVSGSGGAVVNTRVYRNATQWRLFVLNGKNGSISWDGNELATQSYVTTQINNVIDSAPGALNTLNELAAALGDDANFSTTITNQIGAVDTRINEEVLPYVDAVAADASKGVTAYGWGNHASAGYLTSLPNNAATFTNNIYLSNSATTANFITELTNLGAFQDNYKAFKVAWSYAGNSNLDVGFESVELAGCLIECWGGTYKHVRLTRPTTGTGGRSIYVYNDQGSSYAPGWRQIWTSDEFSSTNVSNWNTAYGWGNHASVGYLTSIPSSYATDAEVSSAVAAIEASINERIDAEVLPAIDSKLDSTAKAADSNLLDGIDSSGFVKTSGDQTITGIKRFSNSSIVIEGSHASISFIDNTSSADDFYLHANSNNFYVLSDRDGSNTVDGNYDAPHPMQLEADTNRAYFFGNMLNTAAYQPSSAFATSAQGTKADTAHGWGNHASAGYLKSIPSNYVQQTQDIVSGNIHPVGDREQLLGLDSNRWQVVFCEILDSAGQHEKNLQNPEGEKSVGEYETGTVLVWKDGKNIPCTEPADHMRMGVAVQGVASPLIQGAEPVLVTGTVNEGDYLVTSSVEGHAKAISPQFMRQHGLYDCVLGKALENGEGESYLLKTWINI